MSYLTKRYYDIDLISLGRLAKKIAINLKATDVLALVGDLGVGKTQLTKFLIESLIPSNLTVVTSPTFNIVNLYNSDQYKIWHFDLYRIRNISELYEIGLEDALNYGVTIIEWYNILKNIIRFSLEIEILYHNTESKMRNINIHCNKLWYNYLNDVK